jgi:hypothetical protein
MESLRLARRLAAVAGGVAIVVMVGVTASCAKEEAPAPETKTITKTVTAPAAPPAPPAPPAAPPASPTEKSINPTGGNLFTPPVYAPPAPTATPGDH